MQILIWIASGLAAGVLARVAVRGRSIGLTGDIVLGGLGSVTGAWLLRIVSGEVAANGVAQIVTAFVGAVLLVAGGRLATGLVRGIGHVTAAPTIGEVLTGLETQMHRLSEVERAVLNRVLRRPNVASVPTESFQDRLTVGERLADRVATFGGSWTFLGCFAAFMLAWMYVNTETATPSDPYPFILLNLILSCLAAVQAPIIMMSQNRQSARDRFDAQQDYQVNVRAEMQITALHLKLDEARSSDLQELIALQRQQLEILTRLERGPA
jgi:uncharacterized membrane protein/uncharacterized membrane protein YeaQ/YmgE (transglycosylase-associated protein family)